MTGPVNRRKFLRAAGVTAGGAAAAGVGGELLLGQHFRSVPRVGLAPSPPAGQPAAQLKITR
jgi:hypothetical protein